MAVAGANGPNPHVRQGRGAISVAVSGTGLQNATYELARGTSVIVGASSTPGSDSATTVSFSIPSGVALGPYQLIATTSRGSVLSLDCITVTELYASPTGDITNGADPLLNAGTDQRPFRTLTAARSVIGAGDTLRLSAGTFSTGETWPEVTIQTNRSLTVPAPDWPSGVRILGTRSAETNEVLTIINGERGLQPNGTMSELNQVLRPAAPREMTVMAVLPPNSHIRDVQVRQFHTGLVVPSPGVTMGPIEIVSNGYGVRVVGANATLTATGEGIGQRVKISTSTMEGLWIGQGATSTNLYSAELSGNSLGVRYEVGNNVLEASQVFLNGHDPFDEAGNNDNVFVNTNVNLEITDSSLSSARSTGIYSAGHVVMRGSSISSFGEGDGAYIDAGTFDIGSDSSGARPNNIQSLPGAAARYGIRDNRTSGDPVRAVGLRFSCTNAANCSNFVLNTSLRQSTAYTNTMLGAPAPQPANAMQLFIVAGAGIQF